MVNVEVVCVRSCGGWWDVDVYEVDVLFMYSECC